MKNEKKEKQVIKEEGLTYEDYARLPDNDHRYELADGRLELLAPAPSPEHQMVVTELLAKLHSTCRNEYILLVSPIDLILSPTEVRQPDLLLVHKDRQGIITQRGVEGPPDLVAEILSPGTGKRDRFMKSKIYAKYGIKEYWIVDPLYLFLEIYLLGQEGHGYHLHQIFEENEEVRSPGIPCVHFKLKELFTMGKRTVF